MTLTKVPPSWCRTPKLRWFSPPFSNTFLVAVHFREIVERRVPFRSLIRALTDFLLPLPPSSLFSGGLSEQSPPFPLRAFSRAGQFSRKSMNYLPLPFAIRPPDLQLSLQRASTGDPFGIRLRKDPALRRTFHSSSPLCSRQFCLRTEAAPFFFPYAKVDAPLFLPDVFLSKRERRCSLRFAKSTKLTFPTFVRSSSAKTRPMPPPNRRFFPIRFLAPFLSNE